MNSEDRKGNILVVDDSPSTIDIVRNALEGEGYRVYVATSGEKALSRALQSTPDLILLDVLMPGMDGFETCRRLKADEKTSDIPVIFMTGLTDTTHKVRGFEVGGVDYVTKPIEIAELAARVAMHLSLHMMREQLRTQNERLQEEITERKRAEENVRTLNAELEQRVGERTAELMKTNEQLKEEIEERRRTEEALKASEAKYRNLFDHAVEGVYQSSPDGHLISANMAYARMFGYEYPEELINAVTDIAHQLYADLEDRERNVAILEEKAYLDNFECRLRRKDGSIFWASMNSRLASTPDGTPCFEGFVVDVTKRKRAEEEVARERGKLKTLSDNAPFGMVLIDKEGRYTYMNTKFTELFGFDLSDIPDGRRWFRKAYPDPEYRHTVISTWVEDLRAAKLGQGKSRVFAVACKDGTQKIVDFVTSMLITGEYLMTCEDVTEQKRLEVQLIQAQKMEAIGTLAGGVAHDFNNLLMGIQGYASLMMLDLDTHHPHYERLKRIEEQVQSAADLTGQLLGFARGGRYEMRPVNINEIVKKTSSMFGRTKKELTIHGKYEKDLWAVEADRGQIEQVLLNLYVNGWHAMPSGGEIYLETRNVTLDEYHAAHYAVPPGNYVTISVTDTGIGMDEKTRERIFDPFFTTKEMGRGTGLGLAMVYGIMKGHSGFIDVASEPGHGSTFTLYLPASEKKTLEEESALPEMLRGSEAILLVDDEPNVLAVSKEILESLGYTVHGMTSGQEAIAFYREMKDAVSLVILDMIMPGLTGSETFDRIRELNPSAKIILSSGYSLNGQAQQIMKKGCQGFIQKPFSIAHISQKIREVLDM
jgi:two-component system, cell cycle sensor histidine kinase and response regulator CckA